MGNASAPNARTNPRSALSQLSFWRRFHVRMSGLYGGLVFFVLIVMGTAFYVMGVIHQTRALQSRLRTAAITLSHQIDPAAILALNEAADSGKREYRDVIALFKRVCTDEPQFVSIYVFRPSPKKDTLIFAADYVRPGRPPAAQVGEEYDTRQAPNMMDAFKGPVVADEFAVDRWGTVLSGYAPIRTADGRAIAIVGIDVASDDVERLKSDVRWLTFAVFGFAACCIGAAAWYVGRSVRKPLGRVTEATSEIAAGRLDTRLDIQRDDEFGILGRHVDAMAAGLAEREHIRETFGRFVSPEVARRVLTSKDGAAMGGEERVVTVLFTDIVGYSSLSEQLSPADVVEMLNGLFALLGDVIDRHHGCVIEFVGDALLCVFGAPESQPDHAEAAARCAREMQARLAAANREWAAPGAVARWQGQGKTPLGIRIGLHTGVVIAGNVGTRTRVKYAVIGDAVNVAARVEQANKELGTGILMTEETWKRLPESLRRETTPQGEHRIKGRVQPVALHAL